ncbi:alpha/beta fold hydrolase [Occallatibacter savannae]|uniref:alpha/beta fold hydrolase n=1 Tax=Occallatibacter savannae TaxID=1002691 RepID=UPI00194EDBE5|nr:alpha/beta hydrolase [Occallatibacter savannae]
MCVANARAQETASVPYDHNPAAGKFYDIDGFKMYTEVYGSGPPLLMIHGNNGDMSAFSKNVPYFATHYKVILADSRSQGRSLDPDHNLTFEMMADDYAALLDAMNIPSAYVIGWSDGGINALLLAMRHPEKVKRLASTGANLWPTADAFQPGLWEGEKKEYENGQHKIYITAKEKNDRKLFLLDWQEPHITLAQLHSIQAPSLIICGDHDLISVAHTLLIYENIPHANLWVVPNSGHGTLREHAEDFNRLVDRFFIEPYKDFR